MRTEDREIKIIPTFLLPSEDFKMFPTPVPTSTCTRNTIFLTMLLSYNYEQNISTPVHNHIWVFGASII